MAAVDEPLKLLLVERGIDVLFIAFLPDFDRTGCANHAAIEYLKHLRVTLQTADSLLLLEYGHKLRGS